MTLLRCPCISWGSMADARKCPENTSSGSRLKALQASRPRVAGGQCGGCRSRRSSGAMMRGGMDAVGDKNHVIRSVCGNHRKGFGDIKDITRQAQCMNRDIERNDVERFLGAHERAFEELQRHQDARTQESDFIRRSRPKLTAEDDVVRQRRRNTGAPAYRLFNRSERREVEWARPPFAHPCRATCDEYNRKEIMMSALHLQRSNSLRPQSAGAKSLPKSQEPKPEAKPRPASASAASRRSSVKSASGSALSKLTPALRLEVQKVVASEVQRIVQPLQEQLQKEKLTRQRLAMSLSSL
ncbi:unnamed protein product [Symbiodinium natans]|uniref:Uncharacterized protein n=1 Tax=Symbiodinium natans TaxID=878477 RepID=A0A812KYY7_9DINO|nr:unnamed protein product [Symbiodinium natans]